MGIIELIVIAALISVFLFIGLIALAVVIGRAALGGSRCAQGTEADDARIVQEIHAGLVRMEQRIESLETIVLNSTKDAYSEK